MRGTVGGHVGSVCGEEFHVAAIQFAEADVVTVQEGRGGGRIPPVGGGYGGWGDGGEFTRSVPSVGIVQFLSEGQAIE